MSARPWQVWSYRPGQPRHVVTTYATRDKALQAAAHWNGIAARHGLSHSYAVRKRS